jgi:hydrogenase nickel incorporation protein HypB
MCGICGCREHVRAEAEPVHVRAHGHEHAHDHAHDDRGARARRIRVEESLLAENDRRAHALRLRLAGLGIDAIGLLGGPGSGKTTLLEATLRALAEPRAEAVIEGDCAGDRDARRVAAAGARVAQIETGSLCHLDAQLVEHALAKLDLDGVRRLWIENVGNLVCPAPFACGEARRVVVVSTAEGDDKPEKYPAAIAAADLLVVSKLDLLPHVDFDLARCLAAARRIRPGLPALALSARSGEGLADWLGWVHDDRAPSPAQASGG